MKYIIDSSAWIEYLEGSAKGDKVNEILQQENKIFVIAINIGEVVSFLKRNNKNFQMGYESIIKRSNLLEITPRIAEEAGLLHAEIKAKVPNFSLADAFIITAAKSINAKVITKDSHFKQFKEAVIL